MDATIDAFLGHRKDGAPAAHDEPSFNIILPKKELHRAMIYFTNGTITHEAYALRLLKSEIDDETLADLRTNIAGLTNSVEICNFPFCTKGGGIVQDSTLVQEYLSEDIGLDIAKAAVLEIYMKDVKIDKRETPPGQEASVPAVLTADKLALIKSKVDEEAFKQLTGTASKYVPELEQRDWAIIIDSNALCYGMRVIRIRGLQEKEDERGSPVAIERAPLPAFRVRKRSIWSDSIPSSTIEGVKLELRIPDHIIDDKSYITIYETETDLQTSMATSSFSETDVSASAGASFGAFSGSVSASLGLSNSKEASESSGKRTKKITIAYNFPRVTLFLDQRSLEITPECEQALRDISTREQMFAFQESYGELFSSRVQLGGRLFATEDMESSSSSSASEQVKSLKAAAAASFSGWGVSASVSASHSNQDKSSKEQESRSASSRLAWQANGGDTLLANRPDEWAPTVAFHPTWRITKQDHIASIFDAAAQLRGMSWLVEHAKKWGFPVDARAVYDPNVKPKGMAAPFRLFHQNRWVTSYPHTMWDLIVPAKQYNLRVKGQSVSLGANLRTRGCTYIPTSSMAATQNQSVFEAENIDWSPCHQVRYNTIMRVKSRTGLFWDTHVHDGVVFITSTPNHAAARYVSFHPVAPVPSGKQRDLMADRNGKLGSDTSEIPHGATIKIKVWEKPGRWKGNWQTMRQEPGYNGYCYLSDGVNSNQASYAADGEFVFKYGA